MSNPETLKTQHVLLRPKGAIFVLRKIFPKFSVFPPNFNLTLESCGARALQMSELLDFVYSGVFHSSAYTYEQFVVCFLCAA